MKKTISLILLALSGLLGSAAEVERVYVTTDRPVYLAGDAVWCALSALDKNGRFSNESAVAYLELVSTDGTAGTATAAMAAASVPANVNCLVRFILNVLS